MDRAPRLTNVALVRLKLSALDDFRRESAPRTARADIVAQTCGLAAICLVRSQPVLGNAAHFTILSGIVDHGAPGLGRTDMGDAAVGKQWWRNRELPVARQRAHQRLLRSQSFVAKPDKFRAWRLRVGLIEKSAEQSAKCDHRKGWQKLPHQRILPSIAT